MAVIGEVIGLRTDSPKAYPVFAEQLLDQHRNIERVLVLMRLQVDSLRRVNGDGDLQLIERAITYMAGFPSEVHDPREGLLFARLTRYAPNAAPLCDRLMHQQFTLSSLQSALLGNVRRAKAGDDRAYKLIKQDGVTYCLQYADHIHSEETDLLPTARRRLTRDDWQTLDQEASHAFRSDGYPELKTRDSLYDFLMSGESLH